jgi:hypothetical protein
MKRHGGMIMTGEPKNSEKNLPQCHFVHRTDSGANPARGETLATNRLRIFGPGKGLIFTNTFLRFILSMFVFPPIAVVFQFIQTTILMPVCT